MILQLSRVCFYTFSSAIWFKAIHHQPRLFKLVGLSPSVVQCCFLKASRRAHLGYIGQKQPLWPYPWWAVLGCQVGLVKRPDGPYLVGLLKAAAVANGTCCVRDILKENLLAVLIIHSAFRLLLS